MSSGMIGFLCGLGLGGGIIILAICDRLWWSKKDADGEVLMTRVVFGLALILCGLYRLANG